jgi:NADPH-ferrihemoprotein reductase
LNYAVFGLGNKTYEHFNAMGKYVDKRLEELGANRIYDLGLGDDDGNIEEDFMLWREGFWPTVAENKGWKLVEEKEGIRAFNLTIHDVESFQPTQYFKGEPARLQSFVKQKPPFDAKNPYLAPVKVHRELHSSLSDRSCMHIEFNLEGSRLRYDAGDHLAVFPTNDSKLVERIGELLDVDLDQLVTLTNTDEDAKKKHPFPCPCTYRTALTHYLDINNPPRTNVLRELSIHASDADDAQRLKQMGSGADKEGYNSWVVENARNIVAILEDMPSCKPPVDLLCELLPRLQARYYSISSSPKAYPTSVTITAIWTTGKTKTGRTFNGVATTFLKDKMPVTETVDDEEVTVHPTVPIFVRKSAFRLPYRHQTPVIMVGPGTGLAPFMGFIQERDRARRDGKPIGETILYFGCRNRAVDFLYEKELLEYEANGTLAKLYLAFSRDSGEKVYVQNLLTRNKKETWALLQKGAHFYICGDAKNMARDVRTVMEEMIKEEAGYTSQQVADYLKQMQVKGKLQLDVWS